MPLWWTIIKLKFGNEDARKEAATFLGDHGGKRAVRPLIAAIKDKESSVQWRAVEALGKIGDAQAVEPLIGQLEDGIISGSIAATALGKIGDNRAVVPLIKLVKGGLFAPCIEHVIALGKIGDKRAVEPLVTVLIHPDHQVRRAAYDALTKLEWQPNSSEQRARCAIARSEFQDAAHQGAPAVFLLVFVAARDKDHGLRAAAAKALAAMGEIAVEPLIASLKRGHDIEGIHVAAIALGEIEDKRAVVPLVELFTKGVSPSGSAARALAKFKDARVTELLVSTLLQTGENPRLTVTALIDEKRAVAPLIAALTHSNERVRRNAAKALGEIGDAQAVVPLIAALKDDDWLVRKCAAEMLGKMGDARAVAPLVAMLFHSDTSSWKVAARALADFGWQPVSPEERIAHAVATENWGEVAAAGQGAVEPLITLIRSYNGKHEAAHQTLVRMAEDAADPLISVLADVNEKEEVRRTAAGVLLSIGDARVVAPLILALKDVDTFVRRWARDMLIRLNDQAVIPLIESLKDMNEFVRQHAADALGAIKDERAVLPLIATLNDSAEWVQRKAVDALVCLKDERALVPLIAVLKDPESRIRAQAALALGRIGGEGAIEPLITALKDSDRTVTSAAACALEEIGDQRVIEPLWAAFEAGDHSGGLISALGHYRDVRAVEPLLALIRQHPIKETIAIALGKIGDVRAAEALITIARTDRMDRGLTALLTQSVAHVPTALLQEISRLPDYEYERITGTTGDMGYDLSCGTVSRSGLRSPAQEELLRRGVKA